MKNLINQLFKFGFVGGLCFLIDYGILFLCTSVFGIYYLISSIISYSISTIVNYILSVKWVFDVDKKKNPLKNFVIFVVFSLIGLGLTQLIMWMGVDLVKINYLIVKIVATALVMIFNFVTRKIFLE